MEETNLLQIKKNKDRFCSREYRVWISQQQCLFCKSTTCDPHHLISRRWAAGSDAFCVPLCREHHNAMHARTISARDISKVSIPLFWLDFLREKKIPYKWPFEQADFERMLEENGLTEEPFSTRKNR